MVLFVFSAAGVKPKIRVLTMMKQSYARLYDTSAWFSFENWNKYVPALLVFNRIPVCCC